MYPLSIQREHNSTHGDAVTDVYLTTALIIGY